MHAIEPYYNWVDYYESAEDERSPFYGRDYSEFEFSNQIYNFVIHPQWDHFGSATLYLKIIFADYHRGYAIIELIGEWNDCINNDIMFLKRDVIDAMLAEGISRFILIGENVLNFHASDDCYYEEWYDEIAEDGGWIAAVNFRDHIREEMNAAAVSKYMQLNDDLINWRIFKPLFFCELVNGLVTRRLKPQQ